MALCFPNFYKLTYEILFSGNSIQRNEEERKPLFFKRTERFLALFNTLVWFVLIAIWLFILYEPDFPSLPGNVLPLTWLFFPINILLPMYFTLMALLTLVPVCHIFLLYSGIVIPLFAKQLTLDHDCLHFNMDCLIATYRAFQVLQLRVVNQYIGKMLIPGQAVVMVTSVFAGYVVLKFKTNISIMNRLLMLIFAVIVPWLWAVVLVVGGLLQLKGINILYSWKRHRIHRADGKLLRKFYRSCSPIMVSYGKTFVLTRLSLPVYLKNIIRGLTKLCVSNL